MLEDLVSPSPLQEQCEWSRLRVGEVIATVVTIECLNKLKGHACMVADLFLKRTKKSRACPPRFFFLLDDISYRGSIGGWQDVDPAGETDRVIHGGDCTNASRWTRLVASYQ